MPAPHPSAVAARTAALLLAAGLAASVARAQNALGDGRGLENRTVPNNAPPANQPTASKRLEDQIRFNNQIATGQAGAGRSFQGSMGYSSSNEFQGTLGSETLFTFRRETNAGNTLANAGVRSSDALRFQSGLSTGQGAPPAAAVLFSDQRGSVANSDTLSSLRSPSQFQSRSSMMPTVMGYRTVEGLGPLVITASPLRGLGLVPIDPNARGPAAGPAQRPAGAALDAADRFTDTSSLSGMERVARGVAAISDSRQFRQAQELQRVAAAGQGAPIDVRLSAAGDGYGQIMQAVSQSISQRIIDPGAKLSHELTPEPAAPPHELTPGKPPDDPAKPGAAPDKPGASGAAAAARPAWLDELDALRRKLNNERSGAEKLAAKPAKRLNPRTGQMEDEPAQPTAADVRGLTPSNAKVVSALKEAEQTVVRFVPEGATGAGIFESRMAEGQRRLAEQRYFDAEAAFTVAAAANRDHPMAVVGRAHAQLGAGLFLSAAANLRGLFIAHPELVSTRYGPAVLPPRERAAVLASQLKADLAKENGALGQDGALLLAYLGRQYSIPGWLDPGLKELRARMKPDDPADEVLVSLLGQVWGTTESSTPSPAAAPSPAPAPAKAP